jgi:hypothetical protein
MSRTVRVMVVVWASALAGVITLSDRVETQRAMEAVTGLAGSNGFLAEFCADPASLVNSPNSPLIPRDECDAKVLGFPAADPQLMSWTDGQVRFRGANA